jgi:hypothetical protein
MNALFLVLALQTPIDSGTFVVRQDSTELARETFELRTLPRAGGTGGWVLAAATRYGRGPVVTLAPTLMVGSDSVPWSLDYAVDDPREPLRILGQASPERFTVRTLGTRSERAREYRLVKPSVVLDDSVFAFYLFVAWQAQPGRVDTVTAIVLRGERLETLAVADSGMVATTLNRDPATLRHIVVSGDPTGRVDVWLDAAGHLMKVDVRARNLRVERVPPA